MVTIEGVDYSAHNPNTPSAAALLGAGKHFICTYVVDDGDWRANTPDEIANLIAGGIDIVANWEGTADRMQSGAAAGTVDAQNAQANLVRLGLPASQPIYFSADWDAAPTDQAAIDAYLRAAAAVLGASRVGVYGGFYVVQRCSQNGSAQWFWQTTAWSGGKLFAGAHLYQYAYNLMIDGVNCDATQALQEHYGARSDFIDQAPRNLPNGTAATVTGDGLRLRTAPGLSGGIIQTLPLGAAVTITGGPQLADGYTWARVSVAGLTGWVASEFLATADHPPDSPSATTTTTTTTPPPHPVPYATPTPIPGPVQDQVYHGTQLWAFPHPLRAGHLGAQPRQVGTPSAAPTGPRFHANTAINTAYLYFSQAAQTWWTIDTAGNRFVLSELVS